LGAPYASEGIPATKLILNPLVSFLSFWAEVVVVNPIKKTTQRTNTHIFIFFSFCFPTHQAFRKRPVFDGFWTPFILFWFAQFYLRFGH
jgi:hypothetical protein